MGNFTTLSEQLDIDVLIELMGEYLEEMSNVVMAFQGTVDKYIGDAIMAIWNAAEVGNVGSKTRLNYTALGDTVNLASRLEGLNKEYRTSIMISESTYSAVKDEFLCRPLDVVAVKGKSTSVVVYELVGALQDTSSSQRRSVSAFQAAFDAFLERKFDTAQVGFSRYLTDVPGDPTAQRHSEMCVHYRSRPPPPNWSGTRVMTSK